MEEKIKEIKKSIKQTKGCIKTYEKETRWTKITNNNNKARVINFLFIPINFFISDLLISTQMYGGGKNPLSQLGKGL